MSEEEGEKSHDPTQRRLEDARGRGDVARSAELTAAAGFAGLALAALAFGPSAMAGSGKVAAAYLVGLAHMSVAGAPWGLAGWAGAMALPLLPFFLLPGLIAALALIGQRGLTFSPEKLRPQLGRINPLANAGQRFGRTGLADFARSTVKLALVSALLGWFLIRHLPQILFAGALPAAPVGGLALTLLVQFLMLGTALSLALGAVDFLWQRHEFLRRNRMSRQELVEEHRESEGDPHQKGRRRRRAQEIAMNRMLADVPKADVVVVNPTHYAVALKWNRAAGRAPVCLAKGTDEVAARIREAAALAGVPIHSDPPTARALHATIEVGREIRPEHYAPVAAAIRYAERMRRRARERRGY